MNFDFPDVELNFHVESGSLGEVFFLSFCWRGGYHKVAGMNSAGLFSAAQMLVAPFEIVHHHSESKISPFEVFSGSLNAGHNVEDVVRLVGERRLGYTTDRKGHHLYADRSGGVCILEPGPDSNRIYRFNEPFTVMTNTPVERERLRSVQNMARLGIDRHQIAQELIARKIEHFSVSDGFEVLERAMLFKGRFTTQCSIVCDPEAGEVYLAIQRDFDKIWKLNLREKTVETYSGFNRFRKTFFGETGITGSDLLENIN